MWETEASSHTLLLYFRFGLFLKDIFCVDAYFKVLAKQNYWTR